MENGANRQTERENQMAELPISGLILKMAVPTIVAFLINSIYSLTDTYFVHFLGTNATAAVSVNASLDQLIMMAGSMLAMLPMIVLYLIFQRQFVEGIAGTGGK